MSLNVRDSYIIGQALRIAYDELLKRKEVSNAADAKRLGNQMFHTGWTSEESDMAIRNLKMRKTTIQYSSSALTERELEILIGLNSRSGAVNILRGLVDVLKVEAKQASHENDRIRLEQFSIELKHFITRSLEMDQKEER